MAEFDRVAMTAFRTRLADRLRDILPSATIKAETGTFSVASAPAEVLERCIAHAVSKAYALGFRWQTSIASFVCLCLLLGPEFDQSPEAAAALTAQDVPGEARVDHFIAVLSTEGAEDIRLQQQSARWPA